MARDLRLFYLFRLLATSYLWVPISVAFMLGRGLDWLDIMLLSAIYSAVVILVEIPTGAFADRIGRRQSMMMGALAMVASCVVAYAANDFAVFAVSAALAATSIALCSGADSAYLYDLLHEHDRIDEYPRRESISSAWHYVGSAAAFLAGGALAEFVDIALAYLVSAGVALAAFCVALAMRTERSPGHRDPGSGGGTPSVPLRQQLSVYIRHMRRSVRDVIHVRRLGWVIAYSAVGFVLIKATEYLYQPYLGSRDFSLFEIGAIFAASYMIAAFTAGRCDAIRRWLGEDNLTYGLLGVLAVTFLLLNQFVGAWAALGVLALQSAANGLYSPLVKTLLNRAIPSSDRRATILSVESIARRVGMGVFSPIAGLYGAVSAMYLCGGIGVVGFAVLAMLGARGGLVSAAAPAVTIGGGPSAAGAGEPEPVAESARAIDR